MINGFFRFCEFLLIRSGNVTDIFKETDENRSRSVCVSKIDKIRKKHTKEFSQSVNMLSYGRFADTVHGFLEPVRKVPTSIFRSRESP